jgi:3'(2'), 5'-bisphosphate nucleotidase
LSQRVLEQARRHIASLQVEDLGGALDRGGYRGGGTGRYWVLDPIDGTKGFLRGDQYAIALALVVDGAVKVGVLGCPNLPDPKPGTGAGRLFSAVRGGGAVSHDLGGEQRSAIHVNGVSDPAQAVVCESVEAAHAAHSVQAGIARRLGITAPPYRIDSQCKYAVVARGEASIYLRLPRDPSYREKVWDHAAGALIIEEAGGRVSDLDGRPLDFSQGRVLGTHRGIVATNSAIHEQLLAAGRAELGLV